MMKDNIKANAALMVETIKEVSGVTLDYDQNSIAWAEGYIERQRTRLDAKSKESLISVIGSFLGECIKKEHGGECFGGANTG